MKRLSILALAVVIAGGLTACGSSAPKADTKAKPAQAGPDRSKLPGPAAVEGEWAPPAFTSWQTANGMTVWYLQQDQAPLLSVRLVVPVGAATDPAGKAGLTSLMVDLLDEGAGERSAIELNEAFQLIATDYGAGSGTDAVTFGLDLLADQLKPSLELLADILMRPKLLPEEFERRKAQRIAAALAQEADPGYGATVVGRRMLFGEGYGGLPPGGLRGTLEALSLDDVKAHYGAVVKPQGATMVVVGALDQATVKSTIDATLAGWTGAPTAQPAALTEAPAKRAIYFVDYPGSSQSVVVVARRAPGAKAEDYFPAMVFNRPVAGSFTSRLNLNLREDKGYTYGARGYFNRWAKGGFYAMQAKVKADTTRASLDEMIKELDGVIGDRPITQEERDKAVSGYLKSFPGLFERMSNVAERFAALASDGKPVEWYLEWPKNVAAVDLAAAQKAAAAYAQSSEFMVIIAGDHAKLAPTLADLGLPIELYDAQGNPAPEADDAEAKVKTKVKSKSKK